MFKQRMSRKALVLTTLFCLVGSSNFSSLQAHDAPYSEIPSSHIRSKHPTTVHFGPGPSRRVTKSVGFGSNKRAMKKAILSYTYRQQHETKK